MAVNLIENIKAALGELVLSVLCGYGRRIAHLEDQRTEHRRRLDDLEDRVSELEKKARQQS